MPEPKRYWSWIAAGCLGACAHQDPVTDYLAWQRILVDVNAAQWTEMYESLSSEQHTPAGSDDRIKLALLLSNPGRPVADLKRAENMLRRALADPEPLTPATRDLLVVRLHDLERRLANVADRGTIKLRIKELKKERDDLKREGQVLTKELSDVHTKLRALTQIERALEQEHTDRGEQR